MADKKKNVSKEAVAQAMAQAEQVPMEDLKYREDIPVEDANKRLDVFPELLAKAPKMNYQTVPTYGKIVPKVNCHDKVCRLNVAKILAMKEAEEKLQQRKKEQREEYRKLAETAAVILLCLGVTAFLLMAVAFISNYV